ncbi:MAG TPA: sialidase family protein [Terriglobales bacterium]
MIDASIAGNPTGAKELLLGAHDTNCVGINQASVAFYLSTDLGSAWQRTECMPTASGYIAVDEPYVAFDAKGNAYASATFAAGNYGLVAAQKSANGASWGEPVVALRQSGRGNFWYLTDLAVDASPSSPRTGAVYVSGVYVSHFGNDDQVFVSHSTDGGSTWTQAPADGVQRYPDTEGFTRMAVAKSGAVYATWLRCRFLKNGQTCKTLPVMLSTSSDGGNTWSATQQIAEVAVAPGGLPNTGGERMYDYPSIAVDNSNGPNAGNLYIAMYNWTGTFMQVIVVRSTDGGKSWSKPLPLAPKSDTHDQFFPAISVNKNGLVGVSWLDRRNDPNNIDYQAFAAISYDGGQTFGPNWQLTTAFSDPKVNGTGNNWMGDYTGNTWVDDKFIAAWMDSSNGTDMQIVIGGVQLK